MMLCFTGVGESRAVGSITMSEMWILRARMLHAVVTVSVASVQAAVARIEALASQGRRFDEVRFVGHGSYSCFHLFATFTPLGKVSGPSTARLNLTQLDVPDDADYPRTHGFFQQLGRVLSAQGATVGFECCRVGGHLNLNKVRGELAAAGITCRVQGYPVSIDWIVNGSRVEVHTGRNRLLTVP